MFEQILGIDIIVALLLPVAWGTVRYLAGRLAFSRTRGRLRIGAWITFAVLGFSWLLVVAKITTIQQFWSYGWLFAHERVIVGLPLVVLPAAATLAWSVPRLWRIGRTEANERRAKVDVAMREAASAPLLVVPVQAAALGAALSAYLTLFPSGQEALRPGLVLAWSWRRAGATKWSPPCLTHPSGWRSPKT